jgi:hypothetical protein
MVFMIARAASAGSAQDIGYLDLTTLAVRLPTRSVKRFSGQGCGGAGGPDATITLIRLDKNTYSLGEEITFEAKIENSGKDTIEIPWTTDLAALESSVETQYFSYRSASFVTMLTAPDSGHYLSISGFSYGSIDVPGTIRQLRPAQSFTVRARARIDYDSWWSDKLKDSAPLTVKAFAGLVLNRFTQTQDMSSEVCMPLTTKAANQLDIILWPASQ